MFVSDLHGSVDKYHRLFAAIEREKPMAVFVGGDVLPSGIGTLVSKQPGSRDFLTQFVAPRLEQVRKNLGEDYPEIFVILGNDDGASLEQVMHDLDHLGLWHYMHNRMVEFAGYKIFGYSFVPPTPFMLKDWERYDVSRFLEAGCIAPEEGIHSSSFTVEEVLYATIEKDLKSLSNGMDMTQSIFLFHTPPYQTKLDRAALDGKCIDGVSLDLFVGSIAVRRFIERRQPFLTLHGHVHESARLTGSWQDEIGRTRMFSAAHDGPELAVVYFDPGRIDLVRRELMGEVR